MAEESKSSLLKFKENDVIIAENTVTNEMYKILSGQVGIYLNYGKENEYLAGVLTDNQCFGEIGIITDKPNPNSAVALTDVVLLRIQKEGFGQFIANNIANTINIMQSMSKAILMLSGNVNMLEEELRYVYSQIDEKENISRDELKEKILKYKQCGIAKAMFGDGIDNKS